MATNTELLQIARRDRAAAEILPELKSRFSAEALAQGVVLRELGDFLWAIDSASEPYLYVDDAPTPAMTKLAGSNVWIHAARLLQGRAHAHYFRVNGEVHGDRVDTAAFTEDHYPKPGVPQGQLSEHMVNRSGVYQDWPISWWVYASPGVDSAIPSPVMIWFDGEGLLSRENNDRLFTVTENLVAQGKLPPMLHVLTSPGEVNPETMRVQGPNRRRRSLLYDTVNDDFNKMIFGELLPKVEPMFKVRKDGYSVAASGQSSGAIGAFNMAWQRPEAVSRVYSKIGTYTSIQWRYGQAGHNERFGFQDPAGFMDGGNIFPFMIRKWPRKNIRVFLSDGNYDLENNHGSWPLQNLQMANSLKMAEYDFRFTFGNSQHNSTQGGAQNPEALAWLWRDYDQNRTEQTYEMDPDEKDKPYFRVQIMNR
ncbi:MAG: alpha/beta hydrolase-fold protein [Acidobacteria bacterium]|nr:alpha/beta hydrolase-fold protein [Acidobacteriota bacterium]MDA1234867.1 alpha/beta hydrolase-fold protein [Acidobacteriota bacterium]